MTFTPDTPEAHCSLLVPIRPTCLTGMLSYVHVCTLSCVQRALSCCGAVISKATEVGKAFTEGRKGKKKITVVFALDQDSMMLEWERCAVRIQSAQRQVVARKETREQRVAHITKLSMSFAADLEP